MEREPEGDSERPEPRGEEFFRALGKALELSDNEIEDLVRTAMFPRFIKPPGYPIIEINDN